MSRHRPVLSLTLASTSQEACAADKHALALGEPRLLLRRHAVDGRSVLNRSGLCHAVQGHTIETFGAYVLIEEIAKGGMAQVYLARESGGAQRPVALKQILPHLVEDPHFISMFLDEARIAARLHHPNVVDIYDLGREGDALFIAMEYVRGSDLRGIEKRCAELDRPLPLGLACRIVSEACKGLHYAHQRTDAAGNPLKIVHRDVSPQNLLISFDGAVKVADFGVAKAADKISVTASGYIKGKHPYMSPEQAVGQVELDHRTDVFALGIVLYEAVTGIRLFRRATDLQTLRAVAECEVLAPSKVVAGLPAQLDDVVMLALEREREHRYPTAAAFGAAIEAFLGSDATATVPLLGAFVRDVFNEPTSSVASIVTPTFGAANADPPPRIHVAHQSLSAADKARTIEVQVGVAPTIRGPFELPESMASRAAVVTQESASKSIDSGSDDEEPPTQRPTSVARPRFADQTIRLADEARGVLGATPEEPPDTRKTAPSAPRTDGVGAEAVKEVKTLLMAQPPVPPRASAIPFFALGLAAAAFALAALAAWQKFSWPSAVTTQSPPSIGVAGAAPRPEEAPPAPQARTRGPLADACSEPLSVSVQGKLWVEAPLKVGTAVQLFGGAIAGTSQREALGIAMVVEQVGGRSRLLADQVDDLPPQVVACLQRAAPDGRLVLRGAGAATLLNSSSDAWSDCELVLPDLSAMRLKGTVIRPGRTQALLTAFKPSARKGAAAPPPDRAQLRCSEGEFEVELKRE